MSGKGIALLSLFSVVCLASGASAAAPGAAGGDLDEVVISGKRAKLDELRKEIVQSEDRFYARYNALRREVFGSKPPPTEKVDAIAVP